MSAAGCTQETPGDEEPVSDSGQSSPIPVHAAKVARVTLKPTLNLVGVITSIPERTAIVSPQIGGWVQELKVVEGQIIHANDPLLEFDKRAALIAVKRAQAVVAQTAAVVKRMETGYLPQEIAGARKDAEQAAATVDGLSSELTALKKLLDRREISGSCTKQNSKH